MGEVEALKLIEIETGKSLPDLMLLLDNSGVHERNELIKWAQLNFHLSYMLAHKLILSYTTQKDLTTPLLYYTSEGRTGKVCYSHGNINFELEYEFADGTALAEIYVPTPAQWELVTKTSPSQRSSILNFIGNQVVADQTAGKGSYSFSENLMTIYHHNLNNDK